MMQGDAKAVSKFQIWSHGVKPGNLSIGNIPCIPPASLMSSPFYVHYNG